MRVSVIDERSYVVEEAVSDVSRDSSRLVAQPSLADHVLHNRVDGYRSDEPAYPARLATRLTMEARAPLSDTQDVLLTLDANPVKQARWIPRGRWRPDLPMGGVQSQSMRPFHLILEDDSDTRVVGSDLNGDERFEWEAFCYGLAHQLCPYWLRVRRLPVDLNLPSGRRSVRGLSVEDFETAAQARATTVVRIPIGSVYLSDLLALEVFLAMVGNRDWAFDYDERGRWRQHNVVSFFDGRRLLPAPFDFQFTAVSAPWHELYRDLGIQGEGKAAGRRLGRLVRAAGADTGWISDTLSRARIRARSDMASSRLVNRYASYLHCVERGFGEHHAR